MSSNIKSHTAVRFKLQKYLQQKQQQQQEEIKASQAGVNKCQNEVNMISTFFF